MNIDDTIFKPPSINILDSHFHIIKVIDEYDELSWIHNFRSPDTFEFTVSVCGDQSQALCDGYTFVSINSYGFAGLLHGYIETIQDQRNQNGSIVFSGYGIEGIIRKRIFPGWLELQEPKKWKELLRQDCDLANSDIFKDNVNPFEFEIQWPDTKFCGKKFYEIDPSLFQGNMENFIQSLCNDGILQDEDTGEIEEVVYQAIVTNDDADSGKVIFNCIPENAIGGRDISLSVKKAEITDVQWSFSESGCSNLIYCCINPDFSASVMAPSWTFDDNGKPVQVVDDKGEPILTEQTVGFDDLDTDILPYWSFFIGVSGDAGITGNPRAIPMLTATNEQTVYIDPIIVVSSKRIDSGYWGKPIKEGSVVATTKYSEDGPLQYIPVYNFVPSYGIDMTKTEKIARAKAIEIGSPGSSSFSCNVNPYCDTFITNGIPFFLGGWATVSDEINHISFTKRVESIETSWNNDGFHVTPTFGEDLKTIYDYVKYDQYGRVVR